MITDIITIGDEILIGQIVNTNASWLASTLTERGFTIQEIVTVGDTIPEIEAAVKTAYAKADFVIVTGGLGPTQDDLTREALAAAFGVSLEYRSELFERISQRFIRRGMEVPDSNKKQAMIPQGFEVLQNDIGSAPGLWYEQTDLGSTQAKKTFVAVVPGVPREMKWLFNTTIIPRLEESGLLKGQVFRTYLTTGIGESNFEDLLQPVLASFPTEVSVASLPSLDGVRLRLGVPGGDPERASSTLDECGLKLHEIAGKYIYSEVDVSLEQVLVNMLQDNEITLAIAESCTGGLISSRLTDVSGASRVFLGGIVAYCNSIKEGLLHVDSDTISAEGAVSAQSAAEMASNVRRIFGSNIGLSTTGIMGPTGGSPDKPVGTVWFGLDWEGGSFVKKYVFGTERLGNKRRASTTALNLMRTMIIEDLSAV